MYMYMYMFISILSIYIYICREKIFISGFQIWLTTAHLRLGKKTQETSSRCERRLTKHWDVEQHPSQQIQPRNSIRKRKTSPAEGQHQARLTLGWNDPCSQLVNCHAMGVPSSILPTNYPLLCMPTVFKAITNTYGINMNIYIISIYHCLSLFISTFLYLSLSIIIYRET